MLIRHHAHRARSRGVDTELHDARELVKTDDTFTALEIKLNKDAKWSDGTPFTSSDVAFTGGLVKEFKVPRFLSNWSFVKEIATPDPRTVIFYLEEPMATFLTRTLTTPIVQEKQWKPIVNEARKK